MSQQSFSRASSSAKSRTDLPARQRSRQTSADLQQAPVEPREQHVAPQTDFDGGGRGPSMSRTIIWVLIGVD
jgi:hypothetical protein